MTKGEYIRQIEIASDKAAADSSGKARARRSIILCLVCICTAASLLFGYRKTADELDNRYNEYLAHPETISVESLSIRDLFHIWNEESVGSDVNLLLAGGEFYSRNGIEVLPAAGGQETAITLNGAEQGNIESAVSFINICGDSIIYRENSSRDIYKYDLKNGGIELIYSGNVGEVFVTRNHIYFTDMDIGNNIVCTDLFGRQKELLVEIPVNRFIICGESMLYLGNDRKVYLNPPNRADPICLATNVDRFFVGNGIIAECRNSICSIDPSTGAVKQIYASSANDFKLTGVWNGSVYFQENGKLFKIEQGSISEVYSGENAAYNSLLVCNDDTIKVMAYNDSNNQAVTSELIVIEQQSR